MTAFYSGNVDVDKLQELFDFIATHKVEIRAEKILSLEQIKEAHDYLEGAEALGKVIILNEE